MNNDKEPVPNDAVWACMTCGAPYGPHDCAQAKEPITDEQIKTVCDILYTLDSNDEIMDQGVAAVKIIESLQAKVAEQSGELDRMEVARLHAIEKRIRLADKLAEAEAKIKELEDAKRS
jgi:hypothetical protein